MPRSADESSEPIAMGSELRAVALLNLGIVETWSGRFDDAERHLSEGAALAQAIGRPYLEVACRAHQGFPSKLVSLATARERGRQAVALAERYGLGDRPILAPALGRGWLLGDLDGRVRRGQSAGCAAPGRSPSHTSTRPPRCCCTWRRACCTPLAGSIKRRSKSSRRQRRRSRYSPVCTLSRRRIAGWLAATQARLGMPDEARATLSGFSAEPEPDGRHPQRARSDLHGGGRPRSGVGRAPGRSGRHAPGRPRVHARRGASARRHRAPATWVIETPPPPRPRRRSRPPSRTG